MKVVLKGFSSSSSSGIGESPQNTLAVEHRPRFLSPKHRSTAVTVVLWSIRSALVDGNGGGGLLMVVTHIHTHTTYTHHAFFHLAASSTPRQANLSTGCYSSPKPLNLTPTQKAHGELARVYACWVPSLDNIADSSRVCCWAICASLPISHTPCSCASFLHQEYRRPLPPSQLGQLHGRQCRMERLVQHC